MITLDTASDTRDKIYFGHQVDIYSTPLEAALITSIERHFPNFQVVNPGRPEHGQAYREWKAKTGNGMDYFFKVLLPQMAAGAFLAFPDGKWGAGVFGEADFIRKAGKPIYEINRQGNISSLTLDESLKLSIEETRKRVYPNGPPKA